MRYLLVVAMLALTVSAFAADTASLDVPVTINVAPYCVITPVITPAFSWSWDDPADVLSPITQKYTATANFDYSLDVVFTAPDFQPALWSCTVLGAGAKPAGALAGLGIIVTPPTYALGMGNTNGVDVIGNVAIDLH